jgi:hypothetical protein
MAAKKDPVSCDDRALKAIHKNTETLFNPTAFKSQSEIQAAFLARRFHLSAPVSAVVAFHAFGSAVRP